MNKDAYETVMKLAKEEWLLSMDGVVKALRYNAKEQQFVAKVSYQKGKATKEEIMILADDWVIDAYRKELANKLIDHGEHEGFLCRWIKMENLQLSSLMTALSSG